MTPEQAKAARRRMTLQPIEGVADREGIPHKLRLAMRVLTTGVPVTDGVKDTSPHIYRPFLDFLFHYMTRCTVRMAGPERRCDTACVFFDFNARRFIIEVAPAYLEELTPEEMAFVLAHELMHIINNDLTRRLNGEYEHSKFNLMADMDINTSLLTRLPPSIRPATRKVFHVGRASDGTLSLGHTDVLPGAYRRLDYDSEVDSWEALYTHYADAIDTAREETRANLMAFSRSLPPDAINIQGAMDISQPAYTMVRETMGWADAPESLLEFLTQMAGTPSPDMMVRLLALSVLSPKCDDCLRALSFQDVGGIPISEQEAVTLTKLALKNGMLLEPSCFYRQPYDFTNSHHKQTADMLEVIDLSRHILTFIPPDGDGAGGAGPVGLGTGDLPSDGMTPEEAAAMNQAAGELLESAKTRGLDPAMCEYVMERLYPKKESYMDKIRRHIEGSRRSGDKEPTWVRPSRRGNELLRGRRRSLVGRFNVILDTSGSMFGGDIEYVLGYLIHRNVECRVFLIDAAIKNPGGSLVDSLQKLRSMKIVGGGGTMLQPALDHVAALPMGTRTPMVVLTDGFCDKLDLSAYRTRMLIISSGVEVETVNAPSGYKQVVRPKPERQVRR